MINHKKIQQRFDGFLKTPNLWKENAVFGLEQLNLDDKQIRIDIDINEKQRLGKYVEDLVFYQLEQTKGVEILAKNIQIQKEKLTLGELDCLFKINGKPIHLEIVYKFYLIDESLGSTEIEQCIGPNRKDSLVQKLNKLREKQLPLLYSSECQNFLSEFNLRPNDFDQRVLFKAQLLLPYQHENILLNSLNPDCIVGLYLRKHDLENFKDCKFYMPTKKDWLINPHENVSWKNYQNSIEKFQEYLEQNYAPLILIKQLNGEILKCFLIWW